MMSKLFLKTIWNQRSKNILILIEFFLIYLVLSNASIFYTELAAVRMIPNCYHHDSVVKISIEPIGWEEGSVHDIGQIQELKKALGLHPLVQAASASTNAEPFIYNLSLNGYSFGDEEFSAANRNTDLEYGEVMKIEMLKGRWFNEHDRGKQVKPAVIDRDIEEAYFDGEALGKRFSEDSYEVIGVVNPFKRSDIERPYPSVFHFKEPTDADYDYWVDFMIRVKDGRLSEFMEVASNEVFSVLDSKDWAIWSINTLENQQISLNAMERTRRLGVLLVLAFVVLNIVLGLIGILWYNTNLRIHELGIKMAIGNHRRRLIRELLLENLILALAGMLPIILILAQSEGLRISPVKGELFIISQVVAAVVMILLVLLCTLLPARIASSIQPAVALKYE